MSGIGPVRGLFPPCQTMKVQSGGGLYTKAAHKSGKRNLDTSVRGSSLSRNFSECYTR